MHGVACLPANALTARTAHHTVRPLDMDPCLAQLSLSSTPSSPRSESPRAPGELPPETGNGYFVYGPDGKMVGTSCAYRPTVRAFKGALRARDDCTPENNTRFLPAISRMIPIVQGFVEGRHAVCPRAARSSTCLGGMPLRHGLVSCNCNRTLCVLRTATITCRWLQVWTPVVVVKDKGRAKKGSTFSTKRRSSEEVRMPL